MIMSNCVGRIDDKRRCCFALDDEIVFLISTSNTFPPCKIVIFYKGQIIPMGASNVCT